MGPVAKTYIEQVALIDQSWPAELIADEFDLAARIAIGHAAVHTEAGYCLATESMNL